MLSIITIFVVFGIFFRYKSEQQKNKVFENLQINSEQLMNKLDEAIEKMEFAISFVLSDGDVLDGLKMLLVESGTEKYSRDMNMAISDINSCLRAWYLTRNFYKVVVFNQSGIAISSMGGKLNTELAQSILADEHFIETISGYSGTNVLIEKHLARWSKSDNVEVISLVKEIKGYSGSFIEVEYPVDMLDIENQDNCNFIIYSRDGKRLLSNFNNAEDIYEDLLRDKNVRAGEEFQLVYDDIMISAKASEKSDIIVVSFEDYSLVRSEILAMFLYYSILIVAILIVVLLYVHLSTKFLTKPILQLIELIEKTELQNLDSPFMFDSNIEELHSLGTSFRLLLGRLYNAVEREKKISKLNMQAQFDVLQAGVNPHFIFNVLNVIANRGMKHKDNEICNICSSLGTILRYSTNTKERIALVSQEIRYLEHYFYLIKERFRDKVEYTINIHPSIQERKIPKLALQQLVENSIQHGLNGSASSIKIDIRGWIDETFWCLSIQDNGPGFSEENLSKINCRIPKAKEDFLRNGTKFEIGGMGITNTYLRLFLIYGECLEFLVKNIDSGTQITIKVVDKRMGENDVSNNNCG